VSTAAGDVDIGSSPPFSLPPRLRLMRALLTLFTVLSLFCAPARAQIVAVYFDDAKAANKYKKHLVEHKGSMVVIGEPSSGIKYDPVKHSIQFSPASKNELFVVDPDKPDRFAYYVVNGEKVASSRKNRLSISGAHIRKVALLMRDQTLPGLTKEYNIRTVQIDEFRAERDTFDRSAKEWQARHVRLVTAMERLRGWLESTGFPGAIKKLAKEIARENKEVRGEAIRARGEKALKSVHMIETPEYLKELSEEISGGKHKFHACESQHLRMLYITTISDDQAKDALELGERVIEGFRAELVDPYLDAEYEDHIPDGLFLEFFFSPPDLPSYEKYTHKYYRVSWRENREARLALSGGNTIGGVPARVISYWKTKDRDLEGIICHRLGHSLASLHYGQGSLQIQQDWLSEAVGYQISFEFLGRNNVTCKAFNKNKVEYIGRDDEKIEGEKTIGVGRRDIYNEIALAKGRPIREIALRNLFEIDDPDLAKSWSFYDYVTRKEGKPGQEWLRAAGRFSRNRGTFIAKWREGAAKILEVDPGRAFRAIEERWREYASHEQNTSEGAKRRH
jgi:hypothetical protein